MLANRLHPYHSKKCGVRSKGVVQHFTENKPEQKMGPKRLLQPPGRQRRDEDCQNGVYDCETSESGCMRSLSRLSKDVCVGAGHLLLLLESFLRVPQSASIHHSL